jgi:hypothetical protein
MSVPSSPLDCESCFRCFNAAIVQSLCVRGLQGGSNYKWAYEAAKWGADFIARSVEQDRVLLHIGDIKMDHSYLGRAEDYPQIDRNILFCDKGAAVSHPIGFLSAVQYICSLSDATPVPEVVQSAAGLQHLCESSQACRVVT